ncbi:hypothetical protein CLF_110293 [Clonorchis sinensis]|uniref:Pol-related protein n=1 Tax=Clonorchis sinensis TaxID=79923 RepID=G7YTD1_CLOSI|nr:hypothetical protein CLF_110293 [Clonorchis sinensis]
MHGEKGSEDITKIDAKKDLGIWLSPNLSFSLHLEKSAQKAFAVLRMIRRTFSRITRTDFQIFYEAHVRPLLEYANPVVYSGRTEDVILIGRVQRAATKMVAGLKSMDYEARLAAPVLSPLECRRLRGDLFLTYALFEQGLVNSIFTVDPANTRRGHGRTEDVILIGRVQRAATKMVAGLKSMDYEARLAAPVLSPLECRRLRGDLFLTYALFEQGLVNSIFTVDPANTRRGHGERQLLNGKNKSDPENLGESLDPGVSIRESTKKLPLRSCKASAPICAQPEESAKIKLSPGFSDLERSTRKALVRFVVVNGPKDFDEQNKLLSQK